MLERVKKIKLRYWIYAFFALIFFFLFLFDFKSMGDHNLKTYILYAFVFIFIVNCKRKFVDDQLLIDLILLLWIPTVLTIFMQFV